MKVKIQTIDKKKKKKMCDTQKMSSDGAIDKKKRDAHPLQKRWKNLRLENFLNPSIKRFVEKVSFGMYQKMYQLTEVVSLKLASLESSANMSAISSASQRAEASIHFFRIGSKGWTLPLSVSPSPSFLDTGLEPLDPEVEATSCAAFTT